MTEAPSPPHQPAFYMARWQGRPGSAGAPPVALMVEPPSDRLHLLDAEGRTLDSWTLSRLAMPAGRPPPGGSLTLTSPERPGQSLVTLDDGLLAPLWLHARHVFSPPDNRRPWLWLAGVGGGLAVVVALVVLAGTVILPWAGYRVADQIPPEWERTWGAEMVETLGPACRSRDGHTALARLTRRLVGDPVALELRHPLTIRVIDNPTVNALALPGGQVVLFRGLIEGAPAGPTGADQVAGVLAHEIGHLIHAHVTRKLVSQSLVGLGVALATGGDPGLIGQGAGWLIDQSYSRQAEGEADQAALEILFAADIDPGGLADFLEQMAASQTVALPAFLSSHPDGLKRAETLRANTPQAVFTPALSAADWAALRAICG